MTTTVTIKTTMDLSIYGDMEHAVRRAIAQALARTAERLEREALSLMPEDTGRLKRSFRAVSTDDGVELAWTAPYAQEANLGAPGYEGHFFTTQVGELANKILREELRRAMQRIRETYDTSHQRQATDRTRVFDG